jgi:hypothetical protein
VRPGSVGARDPVRGGFRTGAAEMVEREVQRGRPAAADQEDGGENQRFQTAEGGRAHRLRAIYHLQDGTTSRGDSGG